MLFTRSQICTFSNVGGLEPHSEILCEEHLRYTLNIARSDSRFKQAGITHILSVLDFDIYEAGHFKEYTHLHIRIDGKKI